MTPPQDKKYKIIYALPILKKLKDKK